MAIKNIAVIGAGTMGQGIAEMLASKGLDVFVADLSEEKLNESFASIEQNLDHQLSRWALTVQEKKLILSKLHKTLDYTALADCDLVIECVIEQLDAKREVFRQLDTILRPDAIIASNTASLSLTELGNGLRHPERTIGLHFLYPAGKINLVEIVRGLRTSDDAFVRVRRFVQELLDKTSVQVYESPGYVTTRLICVFINEALHTLSEGVATAEDIDTAMRMGYDFHYGPLEMADRFGLDSVLASMESLFREYGDLKYRPSSMLKKMVRAGHLGTKTGEGFFRYNERGERL
ncbi:3-hydroxyacyl-CoA dehydrogenase family protein [Paenibacillus silviterrae]|uniref:3-hydroxyacyl-CoA dehydrogenase family protein n=1 Tax=Paenibacillus silviterrae TaxID=3242194 RepID=UPI002543A48D|nr:3-hydroxyacyl-CoA dehydrogenase NAD-binding domain-containing protein [Paenibacillus chinjuensis]